MMSDADQDFVLGCQAHVEVAQLPLTASQVTRLQSIAKGLQQLEHSSLELGAPISMRKVLTDLAKATHMLTPAEHQYALKMARQLQKGEAFAIEDIQKLSNLHASKGF